MAFEQQLMSFRHLMHRHPKLSYEEEATTARNGFVAICFNHAARCNE